VLVHTPHRDKKQGFLRCIDLIKDSGVPPERILLDHGNEETIKITRDTGCWQGFSIYPHTKMDPHRMVQIVLEYGVERMVINSAADWGVSDPLMVPRTATKLEQAGVDRARIEQLVWENPTSFFAQGGRLDLESLQRPASANLRDTFDGNSVLRGQDPERM
jgi:predicted metal-dependent TIM-barrel fold hydrolase